MIDKCIEQFFFNCHYFELKIYKNVFSKTEKKLVDYLMPIVSNSKIIIYPD